MISIATVTEVMRLYPVTFQKYFMPSEHKIPNLSRWMTFSIYLKLCPVALSSAMTVFLWLQLSPPLLRHRSTSPRGQRAELWAQLQICLPYLLLSYHNSGPLNLKQMWPVERHIKPLYPESDSVSVMGPDSKPDTIMTCQMWFIQWNLNTCDWKHGSCNIHLSKLISIFFVFSSFTWHLYLICSKYSLV